MAPSFDASRRNLAAPGKKVLPGPRVLTLGWCVSINVQQFLHSHNTGNANAEFASGVKGETKHRR
eukprot:scaffold206940_cov13-Tisochrysis_lutea.AAC.1